MKHMGANRFYEEAMRAEGGEQFGGAWANCGDRRVRLASGE